MMWAGVIGSPIEHSLSPVIHRAAWEDLGIERWEYRRIEQDETSLPEFIAGLDGSFRGLSVTMPCKQAIIPLLDAIDPLATGVGAVNTVVPSSGVLAGFNTDVTGIASAIRRACSQANRALPTNAVVLGARRLRHSANLASLPPPSPRAVSGDPVLSSLLPRDWVSASIRCCGRITTRFFVPSAALIS